MNIWQQVLDDVIMMSHDLSEKHTSQNIMILKLIQEVPGQKNIQMSMSQQVLDDVIMMLCDFSEKHTSQNIMIMKLGQ